MSSRLCIQCRVGEERRSPEVDFTLEIAGHSFLLSLPGWVCSHCGAKAFEAGPLEEAQRRITRALVESGERTPQVFKWLRRAVLGADASDLARLLDVSETTVSRWENGKGAIPRPIMALLGSLVLDQLEGSDHTLRRLQALASPRPPVV